MERQKGRKNDMKKICFVASSGGHWEEIMCLNELFEENDSFFVTEEGGQAIDSKLEKIILVKQINRKEKLFLFRFIQLFLKSFSIIKKERPDVVITTGALIAFPICLAQKLFHGKVVYIESFARVYKGSITGKLCYKLKLSDLFLVQWEELLEVYPKAIYTGGIF